MSNTQKDTGAKQRGDVFTLLTHRAANLAKTWNADGSITAYGDAKHFEVRERAVPDFPALCELLDKLARSPKTCVVRGKYVGDDEAKRLDPEFAEGRVRRLRDLFPDRPLHAVMFDVDGFVSLICDPLVEPAVVIAEYVSTMLPAAFDTASHYWQLSSSAGAPGSQDKLKAHIWFWLDEPLTGAQLTAWAQEGGIELDVGAWAARGERGIWQGGDVHMDCGGGGGGCSAGLWAMLSLRRRSRSISSRACSSSLLVLCSSRSIARVGRMKSSDALVFWTLMNEPSIA